MERKKTLLGKITSAEFGKVADMPFLFGLQLEFGFSGSGVGDGLKYTLNISKQCRWDDAAERMAAFMEKLDTVNDILTSAKVNHVSELVGKPVCVELDDDRFSGFRILTEVI